MESVENGQISRVVQTIETSSNLIEQVSLLNSSLVQLRERLRLLDLSLQNLSSAVHFRQGLSAEQVSNLAETEGEGDDCAICLEPQTSKTVRLACSHHFHKSCIGLWLGMRSVCPTCRGQVNA